MIEGTLRKVCIMPAVLACILIAACAGGGSGGGGGPQPIPQPQPQPQPPTSVAPAGHDTGLTGSVDQPARATFGPAPVVTATGDGPWFDKAGGSATFPLMVSITGGNRLRGSTAVTTAPNTTMGLSSSATGTIDGAFYGPNAENLGAIWSLSDGKGSALGSVTAGR